MHARHERYVYFPKLIQLPIFRTQILRPWRVYLLPSPSLFSILKNSLFGIPGAQNGPAAQCVYILEFHPSVVAYVAVFSSLRYSYSQPVTIVTIA